MERQSKTTENNFDFAYVPSENADSYDVQNNLLEYYILYSDFALCLGRDFLDTVGKN